MKTLHVPYSSLVPSRQTKGCEQNSLHSLVTIARYNNATSFLPCNLTYNLTSDTARVFTIWVSPTLCTAGFTPTRPIFSAGALSMANMNNADVESDLQGVSGQVAVLESEIVNLKAHITSLESQNKTLRAEKDEVKAQAAQLAHTNKQLEGTVATLAYHVKTLARQLTKEVDARAATSRNLAAIVKETKEAVNNIPLDDDLRRELMEHVNVLNAGKADAANEEITEV